MDGINGWHSLLVAINGRHQLTALMDAINRWHKWMELIINVNLFY
jgi:hypothetical protein